MKRASTPALEDGKNRDPRNFFVDIKSALGNNPALFCWVMPS